MITFISAKFNSDNCLFDLDSPIVYDWIRGGLIYDTDYQIDRLNKVVFGRNAGTEKVIAYLLRCRPESYKISRICFDVGFSNVTYYEMCRALTEAYAEYQKRSNPPAYGNHGMSLGSRTSKVAIRVRPALIGSLVEFGVTKDLAEKFFQGADFENADFNLDDYQVKFLQEISVYLFGMPDWFNTFDKAFKQNDLTAWK